MGADYEFLILGPFEVRRAGNPVPIRAGRHRALLAVLLLEANSVVSVDRLIDALWDGEPPAAAANTLQAYVSQVRRLLQPDLSTPGGSDLLVTRSPGYLLRVPLDALDAHRFQQMAGDGRRLLEAGDAAAAASALREALSCWRGEALVDFDQNWAEPERRHLSELRLAVFEDLVDADLRLGRHSSIVGELLAAVQREPLRERLRGQLMLALYRDGRQAEALSAYQDARNVLVAQLGVEPGPQLRELQRAVLCQDAALAVATAAPPDEVKAGPESVDQTETTAKGRSRRRFSNRRLLLSVVGVLVVLVCAVLVGFVLDDNSGNAPSSRSILRHLLAAHDDAMAVFDPKSGRLLAALPLPHGSGPIAVTSSGVWVAASADRRLVRFDPSTKQQVGIVPLPVTPTAVAPATGGGVWVAAGPTRQVGLVSPGSVSLRPTFQLQPGCCGGASSITAWSNILLLSDAAGLHRLNSANGQSEETYLRRPTAYATTTPDGTFWASDGWTHLAHLRSQTDKVIGTWHLTPGGHPAQLGQMAFGAGRVWEAAPGANAVFVLGGGRPPVRTIKVGSRPSTLAFGAGTVWVGTAGDGAVRRIDPGSERVAPGGFHVDGVPSGIAVADGDVWVVVQPREAAPDAPGVIAYDDTSGLTGNIYTVRADGSDRHQLTHNQPGTWSIFPSWSPNGRYIAFGAGPVNWAALQTGRATMKTRMEIYVMRRDGSNIHRITTPSAHSPYGAFTPMWSPDGRHILDRVGGSVNGYGFGDVWVMNANGSDPHPLTHHRVNQDAYFPSGWTADGRYAIYGHVTYNNGVPVTAKSYVTTVTGHIVDRLPAVATPSGNGTLVALVRPDASGVQSISIADAHGRHPIVVAPHPVASENLEPVWSPDQTRLAYAGSWETPTNLIVIRADGSGRAILVGDQATGDPAWRPVP